MKAVPSIYFNQQYYKLGDMVVVEYKYANEGNKRIIGKIKCIDLELCSNLTIDASKKYSSCVKNIGLEHITDMWFL